MEKEELDAYVWNEAGDLFLTPPTSLRQGAMKVAEHANECL
jgi:hypothetical protein